MRADSITVSLAGGKECKKHILLTNCRSSLDEKPELVQTEDTKTLICARRLAPTLILRALILCHPANGCCCCLLAHYKLVECRGENWRRKEALGGLRTFQIELLASPFRNGSSRPCGSALFLRHISRVFFPTINAGPITPQLDSGMLL